MNNPLLVDHFCINRGTSQLYQCGLLISFYSPLSRTKHVHKNKKEFGPKSALRNRLVQIHKSYIKNRTRLSMQDRIRKKDVYVACSHELVGRQDPGKTLGHVPEA